MSDCNEFTFWLQFCVSLCLLSIFSCDFPNIASQLGESSVF